jgi:hypothetical protein
MIIMVVLILVSVVQQAMLKWYLIIIQMRIGKLIKL